MSEFKFGDKVWHEDLGLGVIVEFNKKTVHALVVFESEGAHVKTNFGPSNIDQLEPVSEWVKLTESTPEADKTVLVCWAGNDDIEPELDYMTCHPSYGEMWANGNEYTHWMPLPEPPKELL